MVGFTFLAHPPIANLFSPRPATSAFDETQRRLQIITGDIAAHQHTTRRSSISSGYAMALGVSGDCLTGQD
jgi:hypothetical protein